MWEWQWMVYLVCDKLMTLLGWIQPICARIDPHDTGGYKAGKIMARSVKYNCRLWLGRPYASVGSKFTRVCLLHRVLERDSETSNPLDDYQAAKWLTWKWKWVNAVGSNCRWKWQLCWQAGWYDRLHYSLKLLLHFCLVNLITEAVLP